MSAAGALIPGRVAISADGNQHDCDDIGASALALAILAKTGNASRLVYKGYADHVWSSGSGTWCRASTSRETLMRDSSVETAKKYGGFNLNAFVNAKANTNAAVDRLTAEINASTSSNPLWIIAAGPLEVIGRAMAKAASSRRQYVTVISHSSWNEGHADKPSGSESPRHSGWTLSEMKNRSPGFKVVDLPDQNAKLRTSASTWSGFKYSDDPKLKWIHSRLMFRNKDFDGIDCSDAGMTYWLATGRSDKYASYDKIRSLID
jgi:hypothetical protein